MSDVRVLCIRVDEDNLPKDKWEAGALWGQAYERIRIMLAAWRPEKRGGAK